METENDRQAKLILDFCRELIGRMANTNLRLTSEQIVKKFRKFANTKL